MQINASQCECKEMQVNVSSAMKYSSKNSYCFHTEGFTFFKVAFPSSILRHKITGRGSTGL